MQNVLIFKYLIPQSPPIVESEEDWQKRERVNSL